MSLHFCVVTIRGLSLHTKSIYLKMASLESIAVYHMSDLEYRKTIDIVGMILKTMDSSNAGEKKKTTETTGKIVECII